MRCRITISGRVQGVGFRYATVREARRLRLRGWVRNTDDGCVEVVVDGPPADVQQLVGWCRSGPPGARVRQVEETEIAATEPLGEFQITY